MVVVGVVVRVVDCEVVALDVTVLVAEVVGDVDCVVLGEVVRVLVPVEDRLVVGEDVTEVVVVGEVVADVVCNTRKTTQDKYAVNIPPLDNRC
jgi:hypothetical protein